MNKADLTPNDILRLTDEARKEAMEIVAQFSPLTVGRSKLAVAFAVTSFGKTLENSLQQKEPFVYELLQMMRKGL